MKKVVIFVLTTFCAFACQDVSGLKTDIASLQSRVDDLEHLCDKMNTNINSMQEIVTALQRKYYVSEVLKLDNGYRILFTNGNSIDIFNGASSSISVKQGNDGVWYWMLDGNWLLDANGDKIPTTGIAPKVEIKDGYWYISTDNGLTWSKLDRATGEDGDTFFTSVTDDDKCVYLTLIDGRVLTLPKAPALSLSFPRTEYHPKSPSMTIEFSIRGADSRVRVYAFCSNSVNASISLNGSSKGTLIVDFLTDDYAGNVLVLARCGEDKVMEILEFEKGVMTSSSSNEYSVGYQGGEINIAVTHNLDIKVDADVNWITNNNTKNIINEELCFYVAENTDLYERSGLITIKSQEDDSLLQFIVHQAAKPILELEVTSKVMMVGDAYTLGYRTNLAGELSWTSSNTAVATVTSSGVVSALAIGVATITVSGNNGVLSSSCEVTVKSFTGTIGGRTYVDLGLPSGKLWSITNFGAYTDTENGSYLMWYNLNNITNSWGSRWGVPTSAEFSELINYCSYSWTTKNGVNGYLFTGSNGATMFIPAAGFRINYNGYTSQTQGGGTMLMYWSSTKSSYEWEGQSFAFVLMGDESSLSANNTYNMTMTMTPIRPIVR